MVENFWMDRKVSVTYGGVIKIHKAAAIKYPNKYTRGLAQTNPIYIVYTHSHPLHNLICGRSVIRSYLSVNSTTSIDC